jgi:hypothetical protein
MAVPTSFSIRREYIIMPPNGKRVTAICLRWWKQKQMIYQTIHTIIQWANQAVKWTTELHSKSIG